MADFQNTQSDAEQLARRPDAEELVDAVQTRLEAEKKRRADFYEWLDEDKKAEFIDGQIFVHSPVVKRHADATKLLTKLLDTFVEIHQIGFVAMEKVLIRLRRDDFEPDVAYWDASIADAFTEDQIFFPAPTFVAEVLSPSTEGIDRKQKFDAYAAAGVKEYWIVDAKHQRIERFELEATGGYSEVHDYGVEETISSTAVEMFSLPVAAVFDAKVNLRVLGEMLAR